ncbi:hypothetical protein DFA_06220 [Cavenderia fasciculata]|uniref:Uncharacterized protein n=1 Tax=Cavenderia fasciculata TaxID=261658 RepID=F4PKF7_CACFS|nr:uncharacterized protein DFA_06220 [Cavenderia fasciculata]EGG24081.1 hypothetical protein DFA_06220 [Cavenderia fasciculata]|eukprot:XP_004361932.1 hypothetical protein DFA_06220 [Cavenderia fasciculata]
MKEGVIFWPIELPFFVIMLPVYIYQAYLTYKEYKKEIPAFNPIFKPKPVAFCVFASLVIGTIFRIVTCALVVYYNEAEPYSYPIMHTVFMFCITCYIMEWYFIVFFWISIVVGFLTNRNVLDMQILARVEIWLWSSIGILWLYHFMLAAFDFHGRHLINVDDFWRIGFNVFVTEMLGLFIYYSTFLLRKFRSTAHDDYIYKKLIWFLVVFANVVIGSIILNFFYVFYARGRGYWQYGSNLLFFVCEFGQGLAVYLLLGKGWLAERLSKLIGIPRFKNSQDKLVDANKTPSDPKQRIMGLDYFSNSTHVPSNKAGGGGATNITVSSSFSPEYYNSHITPQNSSLDEESNIASTPPPQPKNRNNNGGGVELENTNKKEQKEEKLVDISSDENNTPKLNSSNNNINTTNHNHDNLLDLKEGSKHNNNNNNNIPEIISLTTNTTNMTSNDISLGKQGDDQHYDHQSNSPSPGCPNV